MKMTIDDDDNNTYKNYIYLLFITGVTLLSHLKSSHIILYYIISNNKIKEVLVAFRQGLEVALCWVRSMRYQP